MKIRTLTMEDNRAITCYKLKVSFVPTFGRDSGSLYQRLIWLLVFGFYILSKERNLHSNDKGLTVEKSCEIIKIVRILIHLHIQA